MMKRVPFFLLLVFMALPAQGQLPHSRGYPRALDFRTISGRVTDNAGNPVGDAVVVIRNSRIGPMETRTNPKGYWKVKGLFFKNEEFTLTINAKHHLTRRGKVTCIGKRTILRECVLTADPRIAINRLLEEAEALRRVGKIDRAKIKYDEIAGMDMAGVRFNIALAKQYATLADLDTALTVATRALAFAKERGDPVEMAEALEDLGDIHVHRFEFPAALDLFNEAIGKEPRREADLCVKIADIHLILNQKKSAIEYYRMAVRLNPKLAESLKAKMDGIQPGPPEGKSALRDQAVASGIVEKHDKRLAGVLRKAAAYAEKLENAAFHSICIEDVNETTWPGMPYSRENTYRYDFQIVRDKSRVSEKRKLLLLNGKKAGKKNARQRTIFQSHLKIFAVIDMLGMKNQGGYRYRILKEECLDGKPCLLVEIRKKAGIADEFRLEGTALINPDDGSVVRIELSPTSILGYEGRRVMAREMGFEDAVIKDVHWFEVRKKGLNFPSRSRLTEHLKLGGLYMPHYDMSYQYSRYTFFNVRIKDVKIR